MQGKHIYDEAYKMFQENYPDPHKHGLNFAKVIDSKLKNWLDPQRAALRKETNWQPGQAKPYATGELRNGGKSDLLSMRRHCLYKELHMSLCPSHALQTASRRQTITSLHVDCLCQPQSFHVHKAFRPGVLVTVLIISNQAQVIVDCSSASPIDGVRPARTARICTIQ